LQVGDGLFCPVNVRNRTLRQIGFEARDLLEDSQQALDGRSFISVRVREKDDVVRVHAALESDSIVVKARKYTVFSGRGEQATKYFHGADEQQGERESPWRTPRR